MADQDAPSWAQVDDAPSWAGSSAAPIAAPKPQSSWSNMGQGLEGAYKSSLFNGLMMEPIRYVMEHTGVGMDHLKSLYPGQTDQWYQSHLHNVYNTAIQNMRQQADQQVSNNPYPGHQIGNFAANVVGAADPTWLVAPGVGLEKGALQGGIKTVAPKVAAHVGKSAAVMAGVGGASDVAAQLMDMGEGVQKDFDVDRSLKAAAATGAFGAAHGAIGAGMAHPNVQGAISSAPVPDFVKNLFLERGVDTNPATHPIGDTSPLTGEAVKLTPEEQTQLKGLMKTGSVDDIKQFFQGKNGPQPTWTQVNQMVEMRDKLPEQMVNGDNVRQAMDESINHNHRQLVSDHIDAVTQDWKNKPNVEVVNHVNDIQDPQVKQQALNDGVSHENTVGFVGSDGGVRVFAPQVKSPEVVHAVLFHEALGHYGLAQQFGTGLDKVLATMSARNVGGFAKEVDRWQKANPKAYNGNRLRAAEEVLAEKSQSGPLPKSWADAVVSHVRRFGRQMGLKLAYSDAEVSHILSMAHDAVINGKPDVKSNNFAGGPKTEGQGKWLNFDDNSSAPEWAAKSSGENKTMTPQQLNASIADGTYQVEQMERAYNATDRDYEPTTRSWDDVRAEALRVGFSPSKVKSRAALPDLQRRIFQTQAAAKVLDSRISGILNKWDTPELTQGDRDSLRQALIDHHYVLTKLRDDRAEIARALNISKMGYTRTSMESYGEFLREHGGTLSPLGDDETLNRFARTLKGLTGGHNPAGLNSAVSALSKPNWEDYLTTLHQNMMLSGLSTHVKAPLDMMIGIGRDLLDNAGALPMSAAREALRAIGVNVKPGVHPTEVAARLWGVLRSALDAETYKRTGDAFINGGVNPNGYGGKQNARIPVVSKVTDLITAQDTFFRAFSTNMHLYGLGTRQALEEARANGTPKDWDTIMTQGANYARQPSPQLLKEARSLADKDLLLNKNKLTEPLDKLKRTTPDSSFLERAGAFVANFLTPFVRVEANSLMSRVIRRSPLAFFDKQTISELKAGGAKADVAMSRIVMGTAAIASYWAAAGKGKITGDGPDNAAKKAAMEATGWRPHAVHEDGQYNTGNKLGISLNPFDVHNATASMVAGLREAYEKGANQGQVGTGIKLAVLSSIKSLTDMSYISDLAPAINALTSPNASMEQRTGQFLGDQASTMTPNLFGQAARVADQGQPMTQVPGSLSETVLNSMKANTPGLRETLPKRMDVFGDPMENGATLFGQHTWLPQTNNRTVAGNHVDETQDPAKQEIGRLSEMFTENLVTPVQRTVKVTDENGDKQPMKLTNEQLSEYQHKAGIEIIERLKDEMNTPEWSEMSDEEKAHWIKDMQKTAKQDVREYLYGE